MSPSQRKYLSPLNTYRTLSCIQRIDWKSPCSKRRQVSSLVQLVGRQCCFGAGGAPGKASRFGSEIIRIIRLPAPQSEIYLFRQRLGGSILSSITHSTCTWPLSRLCVECPGRCGGGAGLGKCLVSHWMLQEELMASSGPSHSLHYQRAGNLKSPFMLRAELCPLVSLGI